VRQPFFIGKHLNKVDMPSVNKLGADERLYDLRSRFFMRSIFRELLQLAPLALFHRRFL
jgi:hypothetical protein